ncbi:MAG: DEAD/DEAH box helicase [Chloroflexi bacterium]|nr:MAG: DEAD/DEAH box helicase [Chloroflexota bacterium]
MIEHRGEVLFLPADPPRLGTFALWHPPPPGVGTATTVDVVQPDADGLRPRRMPARMLPVAAAVPWLTALREGAGVAASQLAWAAAVRAAVGLVARGHLRPAVTARGFGAWCVGPLGPAEEEWIDRLAAAFPTRAYALPLPTDPGRLHTPRHLITACWDAVADALVRTAAAAQVCPELALSSAVPVSAEHLRPWLDSSAPEARTLPITLGLRVLLPAESGIPAIAVLELRGDGDPPIVIDAADLRAAPPGLRRRLAAAELDLALAFHRAARRWPPLARLDWPTGEGRIELSGEELDSLFDATDALAGLDIEVSWPTSLTERTLSLRAVVGSGEALEPDGPPRFSLEGLLDFRWEVALGRTTLSGEEMEALIEGGRGIVRLHDGWVIVDAQLVDRLRRRPSEGVRPGDALAVALTGTMEVGDAIVPARTEGALADLGRRLGEVTAPQDAVEPEGLQATLRGYQRRGLAWLLAMCELGMGGCLADDMGLGKTIQVIALQLARGRGPMLVICPASLLGNWARELHTFAPSLRVRRYHGEGRNLEGLERTEVVLATYGVARRDRAQLAEVAWDLVVADEAQHAKNPQSHTARELRGIPAQARIALTGTPVENRLLDLWSILDWTTPGLLGSLATFQRRVAAPVEQDGDAATAAHFARLVRPFLLRRTKSDPDVAPELPPKTELDVIVPLSTEQASLYEAMVRETIATIQDTTGIQRRGLVLKLLTGLKQICNHPAHYLRESGPLRGRSGKLEALDELLDVIVAEGEAALVFTQYVAMARLLEAHLAERGIGTLFLHGQVAASRRDALVQSFQDGEAPVFLLSLRAGGVGLNLTRATHVVHYDRWWNPAVEDQATDRSHRIGQDRPVEVHRLVAEGTVEDRIAALLRSKRELADSVIGSGEAWLTELSTAELTELVALQRPR